MAVPAVASSANADHASLLAPFGTLRARRHRAAGLAQFARIPRCMPPRRGFVPSCPQHEARIAARAPARGLSVTAPVAAPGSFTVISRSPFQRRRCTDKRAREFIE